MAHDLKVHNVEYLLVEKASDVRIRNGAIYGVPISDWVDKLAPMNRINSLKQIQILD